MKTKNLLLAILLAALLPGCGLVPDKVNNAMFGWIRPAPGTVPSSRVDFTNNVAGTYMTLSDKGGTDPRKIRTGETGWMAVSTFFGSDGYDHGGPVNVTAKFYDAVSDEYLGSAEYQRDFSYERGGSISYDNHTFTSYTPVTRQR